MIQNLPKKKREQLCPIYRKTVVILFFWMCKERTLGATESKRIKFVVSCLDSNKKKLNQGLVESHLTIFDTVSEKRFFMWLQIIANWEKKNGEEIHWPTFCSVVWWCSCVLTLMVVDKVKNCPIAITADFDPMMMANYIKIDYD